MGEDLIEKSVTALGIDQSVAERLSHPERVIEFTFPVRRDNGEVVFLKGYRAQYNSALGPYKGGIRFHPAVDRDEVVLLAKLMTLKNSLAGLPYGGAKGGVAFNPKEFSRSEIERVARAYARNIAPFIGPDVDIPAPDVNTNAETIAWMADEHNSIVGRKEYAAYTGKPVGFGGLKGREQATGLGAYYIMEEALEARKMGKSVRIAIQGFGNVAMSLARSLHSNGYKVVALSDSKGGIYNGNGIDVEKAIAVKLKGSSVTGYEGAKAITNEELITCECDVLVPAALDSQIHGKNAGNVKAKYVFEAANNPTTPEADILLAEMGATVYPDILVNSGGVSASYIEWMQNREGNIYEYDEVIRRLKAVMARALALVESEKKKDEGITYREAAYRAGIRRLADAIKYQI